MFMGGMFSSVNIVTTKCSSFDGLGFIVLRNDVIIQRKRLESLLSRSSCWLWWTKMRSFILACYVSYLEPIFIGECFPVYFFFFGVQLGIVEDVFVIYSVCQNR